MGNIEYVRELVEKSGVSYARAQAAENDMLQETLTGTTKNRRITKTTHNSNNLRTQRARVTSNPRSQIGRSAKTAE